MSPYGNRPPCGDDGFGAVFTAVHEQKLWFVRAAYLPESGVAIQYGAPAEVLRRTAPIAEAWGRAVAEERGQGAPSRADLATPSRTIPDNTTPKEPGMLTRCTLIAVSGTAVTAAIAMVLARILMAGA